MIISFKYYVYPGNPIPQWDFLTFAALHYMKTLLNVNIQTSGKFIRDAFAMGRVYKRDGVRAERVDIPFEYRVKAQNIVKEKLMSDLNWYPLDPIDESKVDPLYGEWHIPENESTDERKAFLFAHGGAYMFSSVEVHRNITFKLTAESNVRCFSKYILYLKIISINYFCRCRV
jgi:acetyl esterase/lipase